MSHLEIEKLARALGITVIDDTTLTGDVLGYCEPVNDTVHLQASLSGSNRIHTALHEICHLTGTEKRLDRDTLKRYDCEEIYKWVEEAIVEAATVSILRSLDLTVAYRDALPNLLTLCDAEGVEWEHDIEPEVVKIVDFLTPYIKAI